MSVNNREKIVVDEREALSAYFNALLSESPADRSATLEVVIIEPQPEVLPASIEIAEPQSVVTEMVAKTETKPAPPTEPEWGKEKFQVMLFKVSGLSLAVPLAELNGVQEWHAEAITPMPGHAPWYLGLVNYRDKQVPVIDTARFVMPEDRLDMVSEDVNERLSRIVYIGDAAWGLACDEVAEVITIEPEQVRWRSNRTSRRWLAGTVIEQMCALIDPPIFAEMLAKGMGSEDIGL